jgi:RimJ/RimL family protein N-acetyltransferase
VDAVLDVMEVSLVPYADADANALVDFLCDEEWPFHGDPRLSAADVRRRIDEGYFRSHDTQTSWIVDGGGDRIGIVRVFDLDDETPLFDIRIGLRHRGRGAGTAAVRTLTAHVFSSFVHVQRIEATTREDNVAMRRALRRCGYVKEAHHRRAWPTAGGETYDAVGYGILREDWASGTTMPVHWDDED